MGTAWFCDICKKPCQREHEAGLVVKRQYCDDCWSLVEAYLEARDALQEKLQKQWADGIAKLRSKIRDKAPEAVLPDEIE